ncbi:thiamine-monophosphate kinase [Candidatus Photodesmus katoptron]|uniref:Thiamine-monophosphate kinase n=1 Tax=Candidatus Photodesmus katoptron Akat1 TaxID=1236703 RepID=S3EIC1_9GAMM|nr:thiamine-phosphate kinase [Candidatus Photodesmus katoptron]EPE37933.1 thiamine-monophosphate kinase [Candidatus Photodesmus katoptron Akat1]KEY90280.1 thiamine-monophosphate kinase [Candidatus Photodesmus katoptron]
MSSEFNLINDFFSSRQSNRSDVILSLGDDCALVQAPENFLIAISTDTLVAGTHFLSTADPALVAHKALSSSISDLAAMGATPSWCSFALTIPDFYEAWLTPFCDSFFKIANHFGIQLIGGDTTKGSLSLTLTVQGFLPKNKALKRSGAAIGDWIYVTGNLGDSKAGLSVILDTALRKHPFAKELERRHYLSTPRVLVGKMLLDIASAAIDISDGLILDINHILERSQVGASIDVSLLPVSPELIKFVGCISRAWKYALSSGEEYELCFTVPDQKKKMLEQRLVHLGVKVSCIGKIKQSGIFQLHNQGKLLNWTLDGYDHFKVKHE